MGMRTVMKIKNVLLPEINLKTRRLKYLKLLY